MLPRERCDCGGNGNDVVKKGEGSDMGVRQWVNTAFLGLKGWALGMTRRTGQSTEERRCSWQVSKT